MSQLGQNWLNRLRLIVPTGSALSQQFLYKILRLKGKQPVDVPDTRTNIDTQPFDGVLVIKKSFERGKRFCQLRAGRRVVLHVTSTAAGCVETAYMVTEFLAALMRAGSTIEDLKDAKDRLLVGQEVVRGEKSVSLENQEGDGEV